MNSLIPWKTVFGYCIDDANGSPVGACLPPISSHPTLDVSSANAAYIVHCVNHHDELIEALTEMVQWEAYTGYKSRSWDRAFAVLTKVNGQPIDPYGMVKKGE